MSYLSDVYFHPHLPEEVNMETTLEREIELDEEYKKKYQEDADAEISDYERERGKPMPSFEHGLTQRKFIVLMEVFEQYLAIPELALSLGDFKPVPDVAVYPKSALNELRTRGKAKITIPPVLTVEILSPHQALYDLFEKAENFLRHGVEEAWVIVPEIGSVTVFRLNKPHKTYISGDIRHESTDIIINVERLFTV